ncbi:hypothetical protein M7M4_04260 [Corynebacterium pseudogenitalium]
MDFIIGVIDFAGGGDHDIGLCLEGLRHKSAPLLRADEIVCISPEKAAVLRICAFSLLLD